MGIYELLGKGGLVNYKNRQLNKIRKTMHEFNSQIWNKNKDLIVEKYKTELKNSIEYQKSRFNQKKELVT